MKAARHISRAAQPYGSQAARAQREAPRHVLDVQVADRGSLYVYSLVHGVLRLRVAQQKKRMSLGQRQRAHQPQLRKVVRGSIPAAMAHFEDHFCSIWKRLGHRHHECALHGKSRGERVEPPGATCARSGEQHHQIVAEQQLQAPTRYRARARRHYRFAIMNLRTRLRALHAGHTPSGSVPKTTLYVLSVLRSCRPMSGCAYTSTDLRGGARCSAC